MHSLDKKVRGTNIIFKLDMMKAFDRVSWSFLSQLLHKFGFDTHFIGFIFNNLAASWSSLLINGKLCGFFQASRGLKQGDPLSPYLFILVSEALSRGLNQLTTTKVMMSYGLLRGCLQVSHLCFVDDIMIFTRADRKSLRGLLDFIELYERGSSQKVNKAKSFFVLSKKCPLARA